MFKEKHNGPLKIFKEPIPGVGYSIGVDVSEGIATGDASSAFVIDKEYNHVASYYERIAPDDLGRLLCRLGEYYNNALLCVELNNHGLTTITKIKDLEYHNVYQREVREEHGAGITRKIGWHTNVKTKMLMLDDFVAAYRDKILNIMDTDLLKEMTTIVIEDDGNVKLNGKDRTVAACIALQGLKQVVVKGQFQAKTPGRVPTRDVVGMTVEEKLKYYQRKKKADSGLFYD